MYRADTESAQIKRRHIVDDMQRAACLQTFCEVRAQTENDTNGKYVRDADPVIGVHRSENNTLKNNRDHRELEPRTKGLHKKSAVKIFLSHALQRTQDRADDKPENGESNIAGIWLGKKRKGCQRDHIQDNGYAEAFEKRRSVKAAARG